MLQAARARSASDTTMHAIASQTSTIVPPLLYLRVGSNSCQILYAAAAFDLGAQ
jgi:hypothetical protein